jgi:hypothetical protein
MPRTTAKVFLLTLGAVAGWASAIYSIEAVGSVPVEGSPQWRKWDLASGTSSNPYALAHFLLDGRFPPAQSLFQIYSTNRDEDGNILEPACAYSVITNEINERWWSLSVSPASTSEPLSLAVITSDEIVRASDGGVIINVSMSPSPGNWVKPEAGNSMEIQLLLTNESNGGANSTLTLPRVQRVAC